MHALASRPSQTTPPDSLPPVDSAPVVVPDVVPPEVVSPLALALAIVGSGSVDEAEVPGVLSVR